MAKTEEDVKLETLRRSSCRHGLQRKLFHEELVDVLIDTLWIRGALDVDVSAEQWGAMMRNHELVLKRLADVESKTNEVVRREKEAECSCPSIRCRSVETRVGHVRREVGATVKAIDVMAAQRKQVGGDTAGKGGHVRVGDEYHDDWKGGPIGTDHTYSGVVAKGGKVLLGNKYGGKDFWED
jgi:hypothetical protein